MTKREARKWARESAETLIQELVGEYGNYQGLGKLEAIIEKAKRYLEREGK